MDTNLSRREREIVDILFRLENASAGEVREAMSDPPADATVRTILRILVDKGVATYRRDGKRYIYRVKKTKRGAGKSALRRVLDVFYGGSVEDALAAHLSDPKTKLTPEQIERLKALIADAEANSDGSSNDTRGPKQ